MPNQTLSRRSFSKFLAAGAAYSALRSPGEVRASLRSTAPSLVRLSSNENPYGPSPAALKAMTDGFSLAWRYPDEYADMLAAELAQLAQRGPNVLAAYVRNVRMALYDKAEQIYLEEGR